MIRPRRHRAASLALAVLILGARPAPVRAPQVLDPAVRAAASSTPPVAPVSLNAAAVLQPAVYLPVLFNNYDPAYINPFGVTIYAGVNDSQGLSQMRAAGSRWATSMFFWSGVEPNPPVADVHAYDWAGFDTQANNAQTAGVNLFVLFNGNPSWAAKYPGGPVTNTAHLVDFVAAMAERYDGDGNLDAPGHPAINYWSFYAEPDNGEESRAPGGKGWWGNNPAGYAAMLSQISPAIHAANPFAKVLIGGLAYDYFTTDCCPGPFVRSFLANTLVALQAYPGGVPRYLDAFAFHYYPISPGRWPTIREKALEIRTILDQNGASGLPLIVPEMGFWSDPGVGSSETLQAQTLVQMYARGLSVGIQQMSWFQVFDDGPGTATAGLFRNGNLADPKLSYTAYGVMAAELLLFRFNHNFSAAGVEGYVFRLPGGETKTVLWATGAPTTAAFAQPCARRVDLLGGVLQATDGGSGDIDGQTNGTVVLNVAFNQPIYVGVCH